MSKKEAYNCILYEPGDKVKAKYGSEEILEVESTNIKYIGIFPTQFLKFKNRVEDIGDFSNLYIPADETIEKYKDGLKYFEEVKIKKPVITKTAGAINISTKLAKQLFKANRNVLTEEDLKPRYVTPGMFNKK